jgi:hypothetical protein
VGGGGVGGQGGRETGGDGWQPMYGERGGDEESEGGVKRDGAQDGGERGTEKEVGGVGERGDRVGKLLALHARPPFLPKRGCETSLHYVVW